VYLNPQDAGGRVARLNRQPGRVDVAVDRSVLRPMPGTTTAWGRTVQRFVIVNLPHGRHVRKQRHPQDGRHPDRQPGYDQGDATRDARFFAVRLNGKDSAGKKLTLNINFVNLKKWGCRIRSRSGSTS
jgi:hypothetical protein